MQTRSRASVGLIGRLLRDQSSFSSAAPHCRLSESVAPAGDCERLGCDGGGRWWISRGVGLVCIAPWDIANNCVRRPISSRAPATQRLPARFVRVPWPLHCCTCRIAWLWQALPKIDQVRRVSSDVGRCRRAAQNKSETPNLGRADGQVLDLPFGSPAEGVAKIAHLRRLRQERALWRELCEQRQPRRRMASPQRCSPLYDPWPSYIALVRRLRGQDSENIPRWPDSVLVLLPRPGKNHELLEGWRPICLVSTMFKWSEAFL